MRGRLPSKDFLLDPEISRTERRLRKAARQIIWEDLKNVPAQPKQEMEGNNNADGDIGHNAINPPPRLLESILTPVFNRPNSSIVRSTVEANNFELKPSLISLVARAQYSAADEEDPHEFIDRFLMICDTTKHNGVPADAIRLRLFPFAVKGSALKWIERQPAISISTWEDLSNKFFAHFFSMEKYNQLVNAITNFRQFEGESLCATWNRFQELIRKFPQWKGDNDRKVAIFFNGISPETRLVTNGAAGGSIRQSTSEQALNLIKKLARDENESVPASVKRGVIKQENNDTLLAELLSKKINSKFDSLEQQFQKFQVSHVQSTPQEAHKSNECSNSLSDDSPQQVQVNGIWYDQRPQPSNFPRNNNYGAGGGGGNFQRRTQGAGMDYKSNNYQQPPQIQAKEPSELEKLVAQMVSERIPGTFPSNTVINPKEDCMAITTRSGKVVAPLSNPILDRVEDKEQAEKQKGAVEPEAEVIVKEKEKEAVIEKEKPSFFDKNCPLTHEYIMAQAPYPERFKKEVTNKHYDRFLDIFKKLHINIPFAEALANMPGYAKFMKDLLKKNKLQECQTVELTAKSSAFIQQKIPAKLRDPGSFNIPITIDDIAIGRAICDLGASINLMPLSIYKALGIEELKPTEVSLQLADRSVRKPNGIIEDVLVKGKEVISLCF
ncbi:uncharacterized protein LOC133317011 [Gastrolobium bilobum]|uniref:uncharacterized protein LOC133317011 n=1 Tax=Gastrolobium bilobum TaxID=150636 RepID=UPI002AB184DC|nr:uncharacterized protein LOC133317011 [Gastrolobium bilobum]